jgi:multidrug efflux system membrane fusion protein
MVSKVAEVSAAAPPLRQAEREKLSPVDHDPITHEAVEHEVHDPRTPPPSRGLWGWIRLAIFTAIAVAAYMTYPEWSNSEWYKWVTEKISGSSATATKPQGRPPIPVITANVKQGDMDLYLNGLGSVTAFYTVTLRSRVDGELMKVLFQEGEMVKEGQLLAEIDPRPFQAQLLQAQGQLTKDEAALKVAQLNLDRYNLLLSSKSVTQQQIDEQKALVSQCEGAVQADKGQIDNINLQLKYCRITAPITGRIGLRRVDPGNIITASDPLGLAVITQLQPIAVVFTIPQDEISRIQKKLSTDAQPPVEAFDRDFKTKLATGKFLAVDNQVDATTGTVRIKAVFENKDNMLFPNQFVNARLLVDTRHNTVLTPTAAVQRGPSSNFVYVVKPDNSVELRTVTLGPSEGDLTAIDSGLAANEIVVTDGLDKLNAKSKVVPRGPKPAAGTPAGAPEAGGNKTLAGASGSKGA